MLGIGDGALHYANRQSARVHPVSPAGEDAFSHLDTIVARYVYDLRLAEQVAPQHTANP